MMPYLRIKKPCEESLENMQPVSGGKFCDLCSKKVIDFSDLNDSEIAKILEKAGDQKICGIFYKKQLNRPLHVERVISFQSRKTTFTSVAAGLVLTASMINSYPAQTIKPAIEKSVTLESPKRNSEKEKDKKDNDFFKISGKIVSSNKGTPLSAKVNFVTAQKVYTSITDKDGFYSLEIPKEILKYESLLEFVPTDYTFDRKLIIYKIEDLRKKQLVKLDYNRMDMVYGMIDIDFPSASEKSLVIVDGKRLDYKSFNSSYRLYSTRYDVHYIPKEYVKFFTTKETIEEIYIVFIRPK
ncbi:hypothetical protein [Chryseobacterium binzhouense]|uniref:hypothetical protein n=1 Tax=Chryseobacterium binzhouense TaxID=2593646 RepID=UPI00117FF85F|nr:hypothetical protein [Chryseobacterium binzhouense]